MHGIYLRLFVQCVSTAACMCSARKRDTMVEREKRLVGRPMFGTTSKMSPSGVDDVMAFAVFSLGYPFSSCALVLTRHRGGSHTALAVRCRRGMHFGTSKRYRNRTKETGRDDNTKRLRRAIRETSVGWSDHT